MDAIVGNVFNAYVGPGNPYLSFFNPRQQAYIRKIIAGIDGLSVNTGSGTNFFQMVEDSLAMSGLSTTEQAPILMAEAIAKAAYGTLYGIAYATPMAPWNAYLDTNINVNMMNVSNWVKAIFKGP